ncbi:radical SAM/SPASM domain-containing protein [Pelobacter propionicus]|uniref:Radical SAM domain protein n=1 Tax=Pelobacter propionicus (strain DSM 2379 / NBRC 103807 / OttBd1) TaxID=338966 RepID=A1ANH1_PELPD|nr:radical SAM protein [Pelobacter propionicus]ABK98891.1 Radical SAM domain protein [Pelobacter propionicus DSM 2379]
MPTIRYLVLGLTTRCNLSCAYCYHAGLERGMDMSPEVARTALDLVALGEGPLHVQLSGGEPTLAREMVRYVVAEIRRLKRPCTVGIQTNATLLDEDLVRFLGEHGVQVGVSLDGPPAIQQRLRGEADKALLGLTLLEKMGVPFRVTTVVGSENCGQLSRLGLMLAGFRCARGIGLDLLVARGGGCSGGMELPDPRILEQEVGSLVRLLAAVNGRRSVPLRLRELDLVGKALSGKRGKGWFCHACLGESLAVHPDGRLYPCGQTLGDDRFEAGSLSHPRLSRLRWNDPRPLGSPDCPGCPLEGSCPGECPSRLYYNRSSRPDLACAVYRGCLAALEGEGRQAVSL